MKQMVLVLAFMLVGTSAAAQSSPRARIDAAMDRATAAGIPSALLEARVAEGAAKGVPAARIAAAVERRAASLLAARAALRGTPGLNEADLSAGADAVEAGIDGSVLRAVIDGARADQRPVAIAVLTYLHRERGIPVDRAAAQVAEALARGPEALRTLPAAAGGNVPGRPGGVGGPPSGVPGGGPPNGSPGGGPPGGNF